MSKKLLRYNGICWGISLEFKLQDMWIGVYWENNYEDIEIWLCLIPCFNIHYWSGREDI